MCPHPHPYSYLSIPPPQCLKPRACLVPSACLEPHACLVLSACLVPHACLVSCACAPLRPQAPNMLIGHMRHASQHPSTACSCPYPMPSLHAPMQPSKSMGRHVRHASHHSERDFSGRIAAPTNLPLGPPSLTSSANRVSMGRDAHVSDPWQRVEPLIACAKPDKPWVHGWVCVHG